MMKLLNSGLPDEQELQEFYRWKHRETEKIHVRKLAKYFATAFFLEMILIILAQTILAFPAMFFTNASDEVFVILDELMYIVLTIFVSVPPYLLYAKLVKLNRPQLPLERLNMKVGLAAAGIALSITFFGNLMANTIITFFSAVGLEPDPLPDMPIQGVGLILVIFSTVILAPIVEEIIYRGILLSSLRSQGDKFAIVVSALIFGLIHGNIHQFPFAFLLGIVMGYFVIKTNSIWIGIFIHFINNAISEVYRMFAINSSEAGFYLLNAAYNMVCLVAGVAGMIYLFGIRKADWRISSPSSCLSFGAKLRVYFLTFPMILFLGYVTFQIIGGLL